jgi:hypothetical protein
LAESLAALPSTPAALRKEIKLNSRYYGGIGDVTCADVTGSEQDLEFNVSSGGSAGFIAWAVFRHSKSGWVFAGWGNSVGGPIGFLDGDVVVTEAVFEPKDPHCCPTGGYNHYQYHWNGARFVEIKSWHSKTYSLTAPQPTPTSTPKAPTAEGAAARLVCAAGDVPVGSTDSAGFHCAVTFFRRSHVDPDYAVLGIILENAQGQPESNGSAALVDLATNSVVLGPSGNLGVCQFGYVPPPQVPRAVLVSLGLPTSCASQPGAIRIAGSTWNGTVHNTLRNTTDGMSLTDLTESADGDISGDMVLLNGWTGGGYFTGSIDGSVIEFTTKSIFGEWTGTVSSALGGMSGTYDYPGGGRGTWQVHRSGSSAPTSPPPRSIAAGFYSVPGWACGMRPQEVGCENTARGYTVHLLPSGETEICKAGAAVCEVGNPGLGTPTLRYGERVTSGPFQCSFASSGLSCVVVKTGRGFRISSDTTVTPIGT